MIARLIAWSARNLLLVFFGTTFAAAAGVNEINDVQCVAGSDRSVGIDIAVGAGGPAVGRHR